MKNNELIKNMLDAGALPSALMLDVIRISDPMAAETFADKEDRRWKKEHPDCCLRLRENYDKEYEYWPSPFMPPLLILVQFVDADHMIRTIVWIGTPPYKVDPVTDSATTSILRDLRKRRGCNKSEVLKLVKAELGW